MPDDATPVDLHTLPNWLRAAVFLGVPSVIALFLVYVLTTAIAGRIASIEQQQTLQAQTLASLAAEMATRQADADAARLHFDDAFGRVERLYAASVSSTRRRPKRGNDAPGISRWYISVGVGWSRSVLCLIWNAVPKANAD